MHKQHTRRLAGALGATGVLLATVAGPAHAAESHRDGPVSASFPDVEVPVGGISIDLLGPNLWSTGPDKIEKLTGAKVSYDLRGVPGVRISPGKDTRGDCVTPSRTRVVCSDPRDLTFEGTTIEQYLPVEVRANRTARPGDTGRVTITFSADGLEPITGVSEVRVIDDQETLPITGPRSASIAGIGLLMLGAGAAALLATRRRGSRVG